MIDEWIATAIFNIGQIFKRQFSGVISYFKETDTGPELAGLIIIAGLIVLIIQLLFFLQFQRVLGQAWRSIRRHGSTAEAFARNFENVKEDFEKRKIKVDRGRRF